MNEDQAREQAFRDVRDAVTRLRAAAPEDGYGEAYAAGLWDALCAVGVAEKAPHGAVVPMMRPFMSAKQD